MAAFLQEKDLEKTVLVGPPKEAQTNKTWQLKKCVYRRANASLLVPKAKTGTVQTRGKSFKLH